MKILDESHYYPFGLKHNKYSAAWFIWSPAGVIIAPIANNPFKYKFQSQELQEDHNLNWYSYRYRNYDPAIGRFFNVDPLSESFAYNGVYNFSENRVIDAFELEGLESVEVNGEEQYELSGSDLTDFNNTVSDVGGGFVDFTGDGNVDILGLNEAVITGSVPQETQFKNNGLSTWIFDNITVPITDFTQPLRDATAWKPERIATYNQIMSESGVQAEKEYLSSTMTAFGENGLIGSGMWGGNLGKVYNAANKGVGLADDVAKTFQYEKYAEIILDQPITLSRYYDNVGAFAKGRYMTNSISNFTTFDRIGLAVKPSWNKMTKVAHWEIPKGATVYQGKAGMQFPWLGGKTQYFVPDVKNIKRVIKK